MTSPARWLLLSNLSRYVGQFGLFSIIAVTLGSNSAGQYALALAITAPVFVFAGLGMRTVLLTLAQPQALRYYSATRLLSLTAGLILVLGIGSFFGASFAVTLLLISLLKCADSFTELNIGVLQSLSRERRTVFLTGATSVATIFAAVSASFLSDDLNSTLLAVAAATFLTTFAVYWVAMRPVLRRVAPADEVQGSLSTTIRAVRVIARAGVPTGFSAALIPLMVGIPQYALTHYWGQSAVAQLATLLYLQLAVELVINSLSQAWLVRGKQIFDRAGLSLRSTLGVALSWQKWAVAVSAASIAVGLLLFPALFGDAFAPTPVEIALVAAGSLCLPFVYASLIVLPIKNLYRESMVSNLVATVTCLAATAAIIPTMGVSGALVCILLGLLARACAALTLAFGTSR
ncbi:hypothetical protein [Mycetocola sp.]|uniref:hypothetical protein n=1 Tax=Mycetocola sp. TaxID=1871042 RepID=UPI003989DB9F